MGEAKQIHVAPVAKADADAVVKRHHYSGSVMVCSQLHLGVFYGGRLEGAMQFGAPIDRRKLLPIVAGTPWNGMIELNRMAFGPALPRNSESRALAIAFRLMRKHYPHLQWVVSFADGCQCGDGTIYRASGFVLTAVRRNATMLQLSDGRIVACHNASSRDLTKEIREDRARGGAKRLPGFQLRYLYFLDPAARARLTCPVIPFSRIAELGAGMYLGKARAGSLGNEAPSYQPGEGGATPTPALHPPPGDGDAD